MGNAGRAGLRHPMPAVKDQLYILWFPDNHNCAMKKILLLALFALFIGRTFAAPPALILKDHDTWVMAGDSITAQRLHTNFIEAFFRTRYPQLHLHFRNSGIGGNTTASLLARFDYDVAAWNPTIVSVELGMNDVGGSLTNYLEGMKKLAENIRALHAQPLFISSSPVNDGSLMEAWTSTRCRTIHPFTEALQELARQENILMVDQYHPLLALWGPNKIIEDANSLAARIRVLKPDSNLPDLKSLQAFANSWGTNAAGVALGGDSVHPGVVGHYMMAATILAALNVDREVSSATVKPDGTVVNAQNCKITDSSAKDGKLIFTRIDERSPWPQLAEASAATAMLPEIASLSQYTLTIPGLPAGPYRISMDGKLVATLSHQDLATGWNMGTLHGGPLGERADRINGLINTLQNSLNNAWRTASKEKNPEKLAAAQKAIDETEAQLQAAVQPAPIHFEIVPGR